MISLKSLIVREENPLTHVHECDRKWFVENCHEFEGAATDDNTDE
jgi:hypothetical protein